MFLVSKGAHSMVIFFNSAANGAMISLCFWCGQSMEWILMLTGNLPQQVSGGLQRQNHRPLWKTRQVRTHMCRYVRTKSDDTSCLCMLSHFKSGRLFSQVQIFGYNLSVEFVQTRFCLILPASYCISFPITLLVLSFSRAIRFFL